jgi:two-component system sensor histidine kinase DesK
VGLVFISYPLIRILATPVDAITVVLVLVTTGIFAGLTFGLGRRLPDDGRRAMPILALLDATLTVLAAVIVLRAPDEGWVVLFYFGATAASLLLPERRALALIAFAGTSAAICLAQIDDLPSAIVQGVSVATIGVTVYAMSKLRRTNLQLHLARRELATMAVAEERDRIARDLHDTLGHSLSIIAIKSELAGRLLPSDPERARAEIADVERVARESLASVRETVRGRHDPTLDQELANARIVLDAAGIEPTIEHGVGPLPASADAVLAWAVREAVTNVVRHSGAEHGVIRTVRRGDRADLEVIDDGHGSPDAGVGDLGGTGLVGLRARLEDVGGSLDAGPSAPRGYRVLASVPIGGGAA